MFLEELPKAREIEALVVLEQHEAEVEFRETQFDVVQLPYLLLLSPDLLPSLLGGRKRSGIPAMKKTIACNLFNLLLMVYLSTSVIDMEVRTKTVATFYDNHMTCALVWTHFVTIEL